MVNNMVDEKLIKEKLIYLCGIYDTDIDIEDDGVIILDREYKYKSNKLGRLFIRN